MFYPRHFVSSLMSGIELGNERQRPVEEWKRSWVEARISLPLSTHVELQEVGVFFQTKRDRPEDWEICGGEVSDWVKGR